MAPETALEPDRPGAASRRRPRGALGHGKIAAFPRKINVLQEILMSRHTTDRPAAVPPGGRGVAKVTVDAGAEGQRLDNWLIRELKGVPKSAVYRLLRKGEVRVNGKRAKPEQRLSAGDEVRLPPMRADIAPAGEGAEGGGAGPRKVPKGLIDAIEAAVVFEDERFLAIDKPAGLAVHGGRGLRFGVIE